MSGMGARRANAGFTLYEVLVVAAILAIALGIGVTTLIQGMYVANDNASRVNAENAVTSALSFMLPEIRQTAGPNSASGIQVSNIGSGTSQLLSFKTCTGFDATAKQGTFTGPLINYWYDNTDPKIPGKIKRSTGVAPTTPGAVGTVIATGIDTTFQFSPTTITNSITITIEATYLTNGQTSGKVVGTATVSFWN